MAFLAITVEFDTRLKGKICRVVASGIEHWPFPRTQLLARIECIRERLHYVWVVEEAAGVGASYLMGKPEEYRRYAQECLELASTLRVPRARAALHHMAHVWLRLAQDAEGQGGSSQKDEVGGLA